MAKPSSAHSDGPTPASSNARRTRTKSAEPTEPARPVRTTRQPRNASAERPNSSRPNSRGGRSAQGDTGSERPTSKRGKPSQAPVAAPELETVHEDLVVDAEADEAQLQSQLQAALENDANNERDDSRRRVSRMSAVSGISGTTAKTSFSQDEVAQMDPDVIIDRLADLATSSDRLASLLLPMGAETPSDTFKEIRRAGSRLEKLYKDRLDIVQRSKNAFGSEEYIRPNLVLRALLHLGEIDNVPSAKWRPDDVIYKANLNLMLSALLVTCRPGDWRPEYTDALARLEIAFPSTIAGNRFSRAALEFWLNLAAQLTIAKLDILSQTEPDFKPHEVINSIFYEDGSFRHRGSLHLTALSSQAYQEASGMVDQLVVALKAPFKADGTGASAALGNLKAKFRWTDFVAHVMRYHETRGTDLAGQIAQAGGVEHIQSALEIEVERRAALRRKENAPSAIAGKTPPRQSYDGKALVASLKSRANRRSLAKATADPQLPPDNAVQGEEDVQQFEESAVRNLEQHDAAESRGAPRRTVRQQRSLLDPQLNAERISTDFDDETQPRVQFKPPPAPKLPNLTPAPITGKRARTQPMMVEEEEEEEEQEDNNEADIPDPTQDTGFQTNALDFAAADRRRQKLAEMTRLAADARRSHETTEAGPSNYIISSPRRTVSAHPSPSKRRRLGAEPEVPRRNPGSALPPVQTAPTVEDDALLPASRYAQAKIEAKLNRVATAHNPPRMRVPWSEDEENALVELIEEYGQESVSYSHLKRIDLEMEDKQRLQRRSAEDMRFKARNMKVTFLLGGGIFPGNWENVQLSKKEIQKLRDRNVPYEQEAIRQRAASAFEEE